MKHCPREVIDDADVELTKKFRYGHLNDGLLLLDPTDDFYEICKDAAFTDCDDDVVDHLAEDTTDLHTGVPFIDPETDLPVLVLDPVTNEPIPRLFTYADVTIIGSNKSDTIYGTYGIDSICGMNGNDVIYGENGDDHLHGNNGSDDLFGGLGDDHMYGGNGSDYLSGYDDEHDDLNDAELDDQIEETDDTDKDWLEGGNGTDDLSGGPDGDTLRGGNGPDDLEGGAGLDDSDGEKGPDFCADSDDSTDCVDESSKGGKGKGPKKH